MGYKKEDYRKFLNGELTESFMESEMVKDYLKALNIKKQTSNANSIGLNSRAKKVRDEAQKFIKSRSYKDLTPAGKLQEELRFTLRFIREIEKEKLNYFLLAASNPQPVLLVQSPTDKDQEKSFLGYEWSNRKGAEGIHYLNTGKIKDSSSDDEAADDDTIEQIKGIEGIMTPLFAPLNLDDESKINALIRNNYCGVDNSILDAIAQRMKVANSIGELKKEHNVAVFQPDRWKQIKDNSVKAGVSLGLSEDFVDKLLQAIHQESVAQQNQIMVKKEEKI